MNKNRGYIALLAVILISVALLVFVAKEAEAGAATRFMLLQDETKIEATALGESCANEAILRLKINPAYAGNATSTTPDGTCYVATIAPVPDNAIDIRIQAEVEETYTNFDVTLRASDFSIQSFREIPNLWTP